MTKIRDLLAGREKLKKYDELKKWKETFGAEGATLQIKVYSEDAMKDLAWALVPSNIKQIIISALEAEIAKLDEE